MALATDDPRHGTCNGYRNLGCRCDACRKAATDYHRDYMRRHGTKPRTEYLADVMHHGWARYKRGGCRCDVCRAAAAAQKRRQRARHREHYRAYDRERARRKRQETP